MKRLLGKVALITGGGSGIGQAIARSFVEEGAKVAITGRTLDKLQQTAKEIGGGILCVAADVGDAKQVTALVERVRKELGPVDILVNNAGMNIKERSFRQLTVETWQKMIRTNLDGAFYCTHAVFPGMLECKDGVIININSTSGKRAAPVSGVAYAAAKFGMTGLGMGLAAEEEGQRHPRVQHLPWRSRHADTGFSSAGCECGTAAKDSPLRGYRRRRVVRRHLTATRVDTGAGDQADVGDVYLVPFRFASFRVVVQAARLRVQASRLYHDRLPATVADNSSRADIMSQSRRAKRLAGNPWRNHGSWPGFGESRALAWPWYLLLRSRQFSAGGISRRSLFLRIFGKLAQLVKGRFARLAAWTPSNNSKRTCAKDGWMLSVCSTSSPCCSGKWKRCSAS